MYFVGQHVYHCLKISNDIHKKKTPDKEPAINGKGLQNYNKFLNYASKIKFSAIFFEKIWSFGKFAVILSPIFEIFEYGTTKARVRHSTHPFAEADRVLHR